MMTIIEVTLKRKKENMCICTSIQKFLDPRRKSVRSWMIWNQPKWVFDWTNETFSRPYWRCSWGFSRLHWRRPWWFVGFMRLIATIRYPVAITLLYCFGTIW